MLPPKRLPRAVRRAWLRTLARFSDRPLSENTVLLAFAVAIGLAGALGVALFYGLIDLAYLLLFDTFGARVPASFEWVRRPLVTGAGLAAAWWVMRRFAPGEDGLNVPDVQVAVARRGGVIPARPALARTAASALTVGGGASAGSEGPVAVLGATVGSALGRLFRVEPGRMRILVGAGAAAGISAAFSAPLAGAFFALEQILGSLAVTAFPPVVVASVVAAVATEGIFGANPAFAVVVQHGPPLAREVLLLYPLLGVLTGVLGALFIKMHYAALDGGERIPGPAALRPWLGGALVGVAATATGGLLVGTGHLAIPELLFGGAAWWVLLGLALGKIAVTALTFGAGGSGGVFTPALYIGAAAGGAFGVGAAALFPGSVPHPEAYALVGMGALVVATLEAPLTGILLVFEITGDYAIVLPLMLTAGVAHVVSRRLQSASLYGVWLQRRGEDLTGGRDATVLASMTVADAFDPDPQVIGEAATVTQLLEHLRPGARTHFPVVDGDLRPVGMVGITELGRLARDEAHLAPILLAADVADPVEPVHPDHSLLDALRRMGTRGVSALPVTDPVTGRLAGVLDRGLLLAAYERALAGGPDGSP